MEVLGVTRRHVYAPRDVINAPEVKAQIQHRSRLRQDSSPVAAWLLNHFYRHVIGNLVAEVPALKQIGSEEEACALLGVTAVPDWIRLRFKSNAARLPLYWIDPAGGVLLALEDRLVEFLNSRQGTPLDGKLMRVNCPQALALWATEHAAFERNTATGWRIHQPDAVQLIWQGQDGEFVVFRHDSQVLRAEMAYESQMMQHCLGQFGDRHGLSGGYGEHYASACEAGQLRLFSYRTGQSRPHITISARVSGAGEIVIDQIKGKQNRPPIARYRDEVIGFLNTLQTSEDTPQDAAAMGIARLQSGWKRVSEIHEPAEQVRIVSRYPTLVRELPAPSLLVQWLVAARHAELLKDIVLAPTVAYALGRFR